MGPVFLFHTATNDALGQDQWDPEIGMLHQAFAAMETGQPYGIGTASGAVVGGARRRNQEAEQQQWADQQAANYGHNRANYNRAFGACMEGRGYTVK